MPDITPNLGLKKPLGNETVSRAAYNENLDIIDQQAVKKGEGIAELSGGALANRPAASIAGRYYFAQDTGEIYLDIGTGWILAAAGRADLDNLQQQVSTHLADGVNPHSVTKTQIGLSNVDNVKQMPISGGIFTGVAVAQNNSSYTTKQVRNIVLSTADASGGSSGDIWIKYV